MPIYVYRCQKCEAIIEWAKDMTAPHPKTHFGCEGTLIHIFAPPAILFKGSGFYTTDVKHTTDPKWPKAEIIDKKEYNKYGSKTKPKKTINLQ